MARAFLRHARAAGFCLPGVKKHLAAYGIDLSEVAGPNAPGVDTALLRQIGNRYTIRIADIADEEANG